MTREFWRTYVFYCFIAASAAADDRAAFFETEVRPLLAANCQECHNADDQQGGVRLDVKAGIFGSVAGQAIVKPSDPAASRLLKVIRYHDDDIQMPPDGELKSTDQEILTRWIRDGAYWPEDEETGSTTDPLPRREDGTIDFDRAANSHWAYRLIEPSEPPVVTGNVQTSADAFILRRLEQEGLTLSPPVDRRTLARRLSLGLVGIPPTFEEVEAFRADQSVDAVGKYIDRLLDDPGYGERWARHWLDIARYADTTGYRTANKSQQYAYAYTYRDWVVSSLNKDLPYDEFVTAQIAADSLHADDLAAQAALGFLTVGPVFTDNGEEQVNDQIDVITRGLMGMTVACARCHDHKFDPIPTADYYSLYGVLYNTLRIEDGTEIPVSFESDGLNEFRAELKTLEDKVAKTREEVRQTIQDDNRSRLPDYFVAAAVDLGQLPKERRPDLDPDLRERSIRSWTSVFKTKRSNPVVGVVWELAALRDKPNFREAVVARVAQLIAANKPDRFAPEYLARLENEPPESFETVMRQLAGWMQAGDAPFTALFDIGSAPTAYSAENILQTTDRDLTTKIQKASRVVTDFWATHPHAPPRAMSVKDRVPSHDVSIFIRGNSRRRGDVAPRQFPQVLVAASKGRFTDGSGRRELAEAIVDPSNPLTARVIVNRVWQHHFGRGLVGTASDFGSQGDRPTHPELLDYLAAQLIAHNWSLKWLHREILLSATYQQASDDRPNARAIDPENFLLWRQNRRRLEFEPMRDSMLAVSGRLDRTVGGKPVPMTDLSRRSIYLKVDRNNPPELTRTFDVPSADETSPGRPETSVPQQALYYLNDEDMSQLAASLASRIGEGTPAEQVERLFQLTLSRAPTDAERALIAPLLESDVQAACQVLLMSNEFLFVD